MSAQTLTLSVLLAAWLGASAWAQAPAAAASGAAAAVSADRAAVAASKEKLTRDKAMRADPAVIEAYLGNLPVDQ